MIFKFSRFILLVFVLVISANTAFAEGDFVTGDGGVNCSGKIIGKTVISNPNFGQLDFDSHPGSGANDVTDLSVVVPPPLTEGLAPADRYLAACVDASAVVDEYVVKGYAWNTNLGFFSFFCDGGKNQGVACGAFNYGVKIEKADGAGKRLLSGTAWNSAFGYMQFSGTGSEGGVDFPYQVVADKDGKLSGFAWTEAKVWVNMSGVTIQIPGKKIVEEVSGKCKERPFTCVEIVADPWAGVNKVLGGDNGSGGIKIGADPDVRIADGVDSYEIHLYLKEADGVTPMDLTKYTVGTITFNWVDTVKLKQDISSTVGTNLNTEATPWAKGLGGITYKPITAKAPSNLNLGDFSQVEAGHYILNVGGPNNDGKIRSYAPTTDVNVSYTTSMKPNVAFKNEVFFNAMNGLGGESTTPPVVEESNNLHLSKIDIPLVDNDTGVAPVLPNGSTYKPVVYPNGKDGLYFQFRPAVEISTLFAGNNSDSIIGYRSIPFSFKVGGKKDADFSNVTANVEFKLDYDKGKTVATCEEINGETVPGDGFNVVFTTEGSDVGTNVYKWENVGTSLYNFDLQAVAKLLGYDDLTEEQAEEKAAIEKPCSQALGPSIYSIVSYNIDGKEVSYYSNKLPRIATEIANPVAVVRGNLYAAKAFSPSAAVETQETGSKSVNIVRDGIYENITSKISGVTLKKDTSPTSPNSVVDASFSPSVKVAGTNVVVYENKDVHIDISKTGGYSNNQTIVVMNGNVFIDSDIYNESAKTDKLQIVALRPYSAGCNKGNVYIKNDVKNINANIFTDCSIFSYKEGMSFDADGVPVWDSFNDMVDSLGSQLRIFGSIASHNTVGGSDLDKDNEDPKTYLLDGFKAYPTTKLTSAQRLKIQAYDLNYLRLFKLSIQTNEQGMPIDQKCKKALTLEEMLLISQNEFVFGDDGKTLCNGINPLVQFSASRPDGDLVAPVGDSSLAKDLKQGEYDPVYVIFSASTSPLFQR
ncbi:hypothetical protein M0P48_03905 [Candidatus Gracilibacteria bacterium]|nr:hypothetical protein [Candidatus Gracilibacteria bacterium]